MKECKITSPYFIYAGNAYPHKNLKKLIEALITLNEISPVKASLVIASSRSVFTQRLEKIIQDRKAEKFVRLLGFVEDDDLTALYRGSVGFVFPSLSEGFGLPGLEAMAAGTLALVSEIPVFREVYQDAAIYFNPLDSSSIAKAMRDVLEMDGQKRQKLIAYGQNFVKRYSWSKMAQETLKIYEGSFSL